MKSNRSVKSNQKGFTLVELSIVIVIIGLIIAGVTAGQALVKQAQLRSILTQADQIRAAVNAFKLQYAGLPGDIPNAGGATTGYWPNTASNGCSAAGLATANVTADCNGDGDKKISVFAKTATTTAEGYIAWQQLSLAKLYPGSYVPGNATGSVVTAIIAPTANANVPAGKFPGSGVTLGYDGTTNGTVALLSTTALSKNIILLGATRAGNVANTGFLTPGQVYALDAKADDSNSIKGGIYGGESAGAALGTACSSGGTYILATTSTTACTIGFAL